MDERAQERLRDQHAAYGARLSEHGRAVVDAAPALTPERRAALAAMLTSAAHARRQGAV